MNLIRFLCVNDFTWMYSLQSYPSSFYSFTRIYHNLSFTIASALILGFLACLYTIHRDHWLVSHCANQRSYMFLFLFFFFFPSPSLMKLVQSWIDLIQFISFSIGAKSSVTFGFIVKGSHAMIIYFF